MCLKSNQYYSRKAEKDIVCYKALILEKVKKNGEIVYELHSPYYGDIPWEVGKLYTDNKFMTQSNKFMFQSKIVLDMQNSVMYGYHTFKTLSDAKCMSSHYRFFKAIIPQGSEYYEGWVNGAYDIFGYVSKDLKLIEEVSLR